MKNKIIIIVALIVIASGVFYNKDLLLGQYSKFLGQSPVNADPNVAFVLEAYDKMVANYWMKEGQYKVHNSKELPELFQLSIEKATNLPTSAVITDRASLKTAIEKALSNATSSEMKKNIAVQTVGSVVYSLLPTDRNGLLTEERRVALRQEVSNINPEKDLYKDLGIEKGASEALVTKAYEEKAVELKKATSTEAKEELKQITYAKTVLTNQNSKSLYDAGKIEPTVFGHILGKTLYLYIKKISPTTLQEFGMIILNSSTTPGLDSMVIDFRGNIGGDLAFANAFTGLFIGQNQYAYDLFRNETYMPERTITMRFGELDRYKDIAILTDNRTQSTAELTTAILKRMKIAHVVGTNTAGWGTIENTYGLDTEIDPAEKYTLFLVNNITLGDDNQPIEGRGIAPNVNINDSDWKNKLKNYFSSASLLTAIAKQAILPPLEI